MRLTWFKKHCLICSKTIQDHEFLCEPCNLRLKKFNDPGFMLPEYIDAVEALWIYDDLSGYLIQRLKFHDDFTVLPFLSKSLASRIAQNSAAVDMIVPVPLHWTRLFKRGFNQAGEIAKYLAKTTDLPFNDGLVSKIRRTKAQATLHIDDRAKNLKSAFVVRQDLQGKRVALIDDVMTTGSTVNEIAKVLKQRGASRVDVWVLARALKE